MLWAVVILCFWSHINFVPCGVCSEFHSHLLKIVSFGVLPAKPKISLHPQAQRTGLEGGKKQREQGLGWPLFPRMGTSWEHRQPNRFWKLPAALPFPETLSVLRRGKQLLRQLFFRLREGGGHGVRNNFDTGAVKTWPVTVACLLVFLRLNYGIEQYQK